jgi:gas vesicle protein
MIGKTRVGLKYLFWGMLVGVLFAPRSGKETRAKLLDKLSHAASSLLGLI